MESQLQSIEQVFYGSGYRSAWRIKTSAFDFIGAIAYDRTLLVGEGNFSFTASLIEKNTHHPQPPDRNHHRAGARTIAFR